LDFKLIFLALKLSIARNIFPTTTAFTFEGKQQKFFRIEKTASPYLIDTLGSGF